MRYDDDDDDDDEATSCVEQCRKYANAGMSLSTIEGGET